MPITERTLRKWRKEALKVDKEIDGEVYRDSDTLGPGMIKEQSQRILRLTQELLDQHLLRKK